jgi:hypothetical protein
MLKKFLYNFFINYSYKKIISKDITNHSLEKEHCTGSSEKDCEILKKNGIIQLNEIEDQDDLLNELNNICDKKIDNINFKNIPIASFSHIYSNESLAKKILSNKKINLIIKSYLGNHARLDIISLSVTKDNSQDSIISEKWHYDNVGRRLKLFYYLNDNENICTDYVLKTNNLFHKNYSTEGSRRSDQFINKYIEDIKSFFPRKGKILLFDTNGFHRGNYKEKIRHFLKQDSSKTSYRKMLKLEFSDKYKSDLFFDKSNIIGVRETFFSNDFNFSDCPLIDQNLLTRIGNEYLYYDKRYKNNYNN